MEALALLARVAEVARAVNPSEPTTVTQRAFDTTAAEQAASDDRPPLPRAKRITEKLRKPWTDVLTIAHEPPETHSHLLGRKETEASAQDWLTEPSVGYTLRRIANRLGVTTLTPGAYDAERDAILAEDARHWSQERLLLIPTATAIIRRVGDWDEALRLAKLEVGVRPAQAIRQTILSRVEVMERFYEVHGEQPSSRALEDFARGHGLPMRDENRRHSEIIREWRQQRSERGLPEPRVVKRMGGGAPKNDPNRYKRPDYSQVSGAPATRPGECRYRGKWSENRDACVAWVARYLQSVPSNKRSTQRGYTAWARTQDGAPSMSRFDRHGGWESVRRDALKQLGGEAHATRRALE